MATADHSFSCPNCGADVPPGAIACPECGADEKTGWSDATIYDGTGIEDPDEFDAADWQRREGIATPPRSRRQTIFWWVAVGLLGLIVWIILR